HPDLGLRGCREPRRRGAGDESVRAGAQAGAAAPRRDPHPGGGPRRARVAASGAGGARGSGAPRPGGRPRGGSRAEDGGPVSPSGRARAPAVRAADAKAVAADGEHSVWGRLASAAGRLLRPPQSEASTMTGALIVASWLLMAPPD